MSKCVGLIGAVFAVAFAGSALAADNKLFKDLAYDSPKAVNAKIKGAYDCTETMGSDALCVDNIDFIGHKFVQVLAFNDSKLKSVALYVEPFNQAVYASAAAALNKTFVLTKLANVQEQLDLIELANKVTDRNDYVTRLTNFENQSLASGDLTYTFFEGVEVKKSYTSTPVMTNAMPETVRAAELVVSEEGGESALFIRFSFPKLDQKAFAEAAKKPVESF